MKILLISPETPNTFWSFKSSLKFISKKSSEPPLGLLTVAALLPVLWEKKFIDMNVAYLKEKDILWADYVFIGGMDIQKESFQRVVALCNRLGVKVVAGGPMCTINHEQFTGVDHFILNEAEITLPRFLEDLKMGFPKPLYTTDEYPDISQTPIPLWGLLEMKKYATMDIQYSRGCPYDCEFCSITALYGRRPRTKDTDQLLREFESLRQAGWNRAVFIVDDNFIGNIKKLKRNLLPALIEWSERRNYPFTFVTEVSINLSDDDELMDLMVRAGFKMVFVGIETPDDGSLQECNKVQNRGRDLLESVKILQRRGLDVTGGFIVGFDNDRSDIFEKQIQFIQKSGIVTAMVGLLNAPPGTRLFKRLSLENRITDSFNGNNVDVSLNFIPTMKKEELIEGYKKIIRTIYSQKAYFERMITFLREYRLPVIYSSMLTWTDIRALLRAIWRMGIVERDKRFFWKLFFFVLYHCPRKFPQAMTMAIQGFHLRRVAARI
jgi:radical SAM superfamily enzyme YgiQ (UPF0313 family)